MFAGHYSVGKSSYYNRLSKAENLKYWLDHYPFPIGIDLVQRRENFYEEDVRIYVFDHSGGERFRAIINSNHYPFCHGIIFMYDITNRESFDAVSKIFHIKKKEAQVSQSYILVGNKADLEEKREVSYEEGRLLAEKLNGDDGESESGIEFFEISAKARDGLEHAYNVIVKKMVEKRKREREGDGIKLKNDNHKLLEKTRCAN